MHSGIAFIIFSIVLNNVLAVTEEQKTQIKAKFTEVGTECLKEYPISEEDLHSFEEKKFPESENADCFSACVFKQIGVLSNEGLLHHEPVLERAEEVFEDEEELKNIEGLLTTCAKVNDEEVSDGEKGCERARLAYNCFNEHHEQFGF